MLQRVLYVGPAMDELGRALERFSVSVVHVAPGQAQSSLPNTRGSYDLAVVSNSPASAVAFAAPLLKKHGFLYWEIDRRRGLQRLSDPRHLKSSLGDMGFEECELTWHRPSFSNCLELIPLERPQGTRYALAKVHSHLAGRLKMKFGRMLFGCGLLPYSVPCMSIVARKSAR